MRHIIAVAIAAACLMPTGFAQELTTACVIFGSPYQLNSDVVDWTMTLASGQRCLRGLRVNLATLDEIKILTPPQSGRLSVEGPAFVYSADPSFTGKDSFSFLVAGRANRIKGTSTIRITVSVK